MSAQTKLRRLPERGEYTRERLLDLVDQLPTASIAYCKDGKPYVYPTLSWREGEYLYWHGSAASHSLRHIATGTDLCVNLFQLDGLVLARSGMHSSANYRSVTLFGKAEMVTDSAHKLASLQAMVDRFSPGRWETLRPPTAQELKATTLARLLVDEGSAKVRTGPPNDDEADYELPIWAGEVPIEVVTRAPVPDPLLAPSVAEPPHLAEVVITKIDP